MGLFKKKCAYCKERIEKNKEFLAEVKIPEFRELKTKAFCSPEHFEQYRLQNPGTKSRKPYCMNCDD